MRSVYGGGFGDSTGRNHGNEFHAGNGTAAGGPAAMAGVFRRRVCTCRGATGGIGGGVLEGIAGVFGGRCWKLKVEREKSGVNTAQELCVVSEQQPIIVG